VGILSAHDRIWGKAVQTDAKVSPANYGGPLIDIYGRVIGVLVPLSPQGNDEIAGTEWYDSGIGFAIPWVDILERLDVWKQGTDLYPGLLGIAFQSRNELLGEPIVGVVRVNSPAEKAGVRPADRISHINGRAVRRIAEVKHVLGRLYAGDTVQLTLIRDGQPLTTSAVLVDKLVPYAHAMIGILPASGPAAQPGVTVGWVVPDSPASKAGIRPGDVVLQIDGEAVADVGSLRRLMLRRQPAQEISLVIQRADSTMTSPLTLAPLPEVVPQDVPALRTAGAQPVPGAMAGYVTIQVPEAPNECRLWIPEATQPPPTYGLLVWFQQAGKYDPDSAVAQWGEMCRQRGFLLLLPNSQDPTGWRLTEVEFVRKAIQQVMDQYPVDPQLVAVGGEELGGSMAYTTAFTLRDQVRGLVVASAALPLRLRVPDNEPSYRLAALLVSPPSGRIKAAMTETAQKLRQLRYPVVMQELGASSSHADPQLLGRWLELLGVL
jgi:serine protease Do